MITLPDSLVGQLRSYEQRLKKMETLAALAGGIVGLLATFILLFVFDRFGDTPRWARTVLTLCGGGLAAWFTHGWAVHWLWNRRGPADLARLLQRHFKTLGDRLQGVIELTDSEELPENISPALLRAAVRQVAQESERFDFAKAVPVRPVRRWAMAAVTLGVMAAAPFVLVPKAATNAFVRWIVPWSSVERYTFASIEALPKQLVVAHGEPFEISCGLKADSAWKPGVASARLNRQEPQIAAFKGGQALFHLAGQTQTGAFTVQVGDASREVTIQPLHRPEMIALAAKVALPEYLGYPQTSLPIQGGHVEFLEGSRVSFTGTTSRDLKDASMKSAAPSPAAVERGAFITPQTKVAELGAEASFRWEDTFGLTPTQPYTVKVSTRADAEPRIELAGLDQETAILPDEVLKMNLTASDDFGVKEQWLGWTARAVGDKSAAKSEGIAARTPGAKTKKEIKAQTEFSPARLKIPEDSIVELAAYAVDYRPDRKPVESWRHTVYVLSPGKHAERVQQRMDQVLKQLDERIRDEERQLEEAKAIAENTKDLPGEKAGEEIKRVEAGERANEAQLQKLTEEMRDVMKDALRNKEIPEGTVADWKNLTEKLEQQANPPMDAASQALQKSAAEPQERTPQLAEAQKQQQAALDAMRDAAKKMNTTNENLYARNFYNRLRSAAGAEHKISDGLKGLARQTIGLRPEEIPDAERVKFDQVAGRQDSTTKEVDGIVNDMEAFLKRVQNEKYSAVHTEMKAKHVVADLVELGTFVRANLGLRSVGRAKQWGDQLDEWATMLQSECKSQGGGGEMDPDIMEFMISMVRAAVAQDNVRDQTQLVEAQKEKDGQPGEEAGKLGEQENGVTAQIEALLAKITMGDIQAEPTLELPPAMGGGGGQGQSKFAPFEPVLTAARGLTTQIAADLQTNKTDEEVVSTQGMVIELLVPPDKKGGKGSSKMQKMMQQMMATATKSGGGGGNNGKSRGDFASEPAAGAVGGQAKVKGRAVEKAGAAAATGDWPEEYRDQLQAYFQQVESIKQPAATAE